jgi:hypothetical protein
MGFFSIAAIAAAPIAILATPRVSRRSKDLAAFVASLRDIGAVLLE